MLGNQACDDYAQSLRHFSVTSLSPPSGYASQGRTGSLIGKQHAFSKSDCVGCPMEGGNLPILVYVLAACHNSPEYQTAYPRRYLEEFPDYATQPNPVEQPRKIVSIILPTACSGSPRPPLSPAYQQRIFKLPRQKFNNLRARAACLVF